MAELRTPLPTLVAVFSAFVALVACDLLSLHGFLNELGVAVTVFQVEIQIL
jgi:hypothetical protein